MRNKKEKDAVKEEEIKEERNNIKEESSDPWKRAVQDSLELIGHYLVSHDNVSLAVILPMLKTSVTVIEDYLERNNNNGKQN